MNYYKAIVLLLILLTSSAIADTQQEIAHLLNFVANTACKYERNGSFHSGIEARNHIKKKYEYYKNKIKSVEDFIKYTATKSNFSGKKYKVHCSNTKVINSSDWFLDELERYRKKKQSK